MESSLTPEFISWLKDLRRKFHQHPELSLQEVHTTAKVTQILKELGLEVRNFEDMTGAVAVLKGKKTGPGIALRADMDALPILESTDIPHRSEIDGKMHACGHDAHTAIMLAVAKNLVETGLSKKMSGDVVFIFQPAEETGLGAKMMLERGALDGFSISKIFAGHLNGILQAGQVGVCPGVNYAAASSFQIRVSGKGAHGGRPHQSIDPVTAAAHLITELNTIISRNLNPRDAGVISVGSIISGQTHNVIPDFADIKGTIRAFEPQVMTDICRRMEEICRGIACSFRVACDFDIKHVFPHWSNDQAVCDVVVRAAESLWGSESVKFLTPQTGAEDFGYFTKKIPGAMISIGCADSSRGLAPLFHTSDFDIDERALVTGVELFTRIITQTLVEK